MAESSEGPPDSGGAKDSGAIVYDDNAVVINAEGVGCSSEGLSGWQHVRQAARSVRDPVHVEESTARDALLAELLGWVPLCQFRHPCQWLPLIISASRRVSW